MVERVTQLMQTFLEGVTAGVLAEHDRVLRDTDGFRSHDLVGFLVGHYAVLVDACLVCERICTDDRLGRCNSNAGNGLDHAACTVDLGGLDVAADTEVIGTGLERHDALLHGGVACALADAVDGALDLVNTGFNACQRVCNCHAEVVVHVAGQDYVLDTLGVLTQILDAGCVLLRNHVADGIRNVDGSSTGLDGGFHNAAQEVEVGAGCVLSGELDIRAELLGEGYVVRYGLEHLLRRHLQLVLHVYRLVARKV